MKKFRYLNILLIIFLLNISSGSDTYCLAPSDSNTSIMVGFSTQECIEKTSYKNAIKSFDEAQRVRKLILDNIKIKPKKQFDGKAIACIFITKFCPVGCDHCFFGSPIPKGGKDRSTVYDDEGIEKLISFLNDANMGYLLISGGGDPFMERENLLKLVKRVKSDRLTLVTSGYWAKGEKGAKKRVDELYNAFKQRKTKGKVLLRLSVDKEHIAKIGAQPFFNLIKIFQEKFKEEEDFEFQVHTLIDDDITEELLSQLPVVNFQVHTGSISNLLSTTSTDETIKISIKKKEVTLEGGYKFVIGYAKRFYSDWKVDLNNPKIIKRNTTVFDRDMSENELDNTAVVHNKSGLDGLNYGINYDGFVRIWGANSPDNRSNIYNDSKTDVVQQSFDDIISLAYIEKGASYRNSIINEINPKAVTRTKAINIRDFIGSIINEEEKTRLYFAIRALQDYIQEGRIPLKQIFAWPEEIRNLISLERSSLIGAYSSSRNNIVKQFLKKDTLKIADLVYLYELVNLGHYDITPKEMELIIIESKYLSKAEVSDFFNKIHNKKSGQVTLLEKPLTKAA